MSNKGNILLCDMGGTHARFAKFESNGQYSHFKKYRLNKFQSFDAIVTQYMDNVGMAFGTARFAVARRPENGVIKYKRFAGDPDYEINFPALERQFGWSDCVYLNDLAAGAYGVRVLNESQLSTVIDATVSPITDNTILISVGTGVGHAGITDKEILQTAGGHYLPVSVTDEHRQLEAFVRSKKDENLCLIMEDFVSARGLRMIAEYVTGRPNNNDSNPQFFKDLANQPDVTRLFFEFLGMHTHNLVNVFGFYGGVYFAGGVIDYLIRHDLANWAAFSEYFKPSMVSSVNDRLNGCAVYYVTHDELPLLGLSTL